MSLLNIINSLSKNILQGYKGGSSAEGVITSIIDSFSDGSHRFDKWIALGNAVQATDAILTVLKKDTTITNSASLAASVENIVMSYIKISDQISETGSFKPKDVTNLIGDTIIALGDLGEARGKLNRPAQIAFNYLGFRIKDFGADRLGNSVMNADDFNWENIFGALTDSQFWYDLWENDSRFFYNLIPDWVRDWFEFGNYWDEWDKLNRSGQTRTHDPLALDLDGDGLETVGTNRFSGSLFDHNRDGIRTATGWVAADDGFLVYDRNGNGMIDHGGELFGDNTLLADGSRAAHGYAALAELDGNGDGKVDAADADFSSLRVWRDLNQDGISQSGELFALVDVGVQALNLAHTTPNTHLGNGNFLAQSGSYTKTDGTTAQMGDLDLAADLLFSRHSETVELTDEQRQAPNLQGMGRLRDLREAAALSGSLSAVLAAYAEAANDDVWEWGFKVA